MLTCCPLHLALTEPGQDASMGAGDIDVITCLRIEHISASRLEKYRPTTFELFSPHMIVQSVPLQGILPSITVTPWLQDVEPA